MKLAVSIVLVLACAKPTPVTSTPVPSARADAGVEATAGAVPPADAATAAMPDAAPASVLAEGIGSCKRAADCEISYWQKDGCECTTTCTVAAARGGQEQ